MAPNEIKPYTPPNCTVGQRVSNRVRMTDGRLVWIDGLDMDERIMWSRHSASRASAGAYLMSVSGKPEILSAQHTSVCHTDAEEHIITVFDLVRRTVIIRAGTPIKVTFDVDLGQRMNGELWATYKTPGMHTHCSDVHGLEWECRPIPTRSPIQSHFYPMPTMSWIQGDTRRFTWVGAQPTGVGTTKDTIILMLDRSGNRDDARGLGQGITDARAVTLTFYMIVETFRDAKTPTSTSMRASTWLLQPPMILTRSDD